jgi:hypothetical protein
MLAEYGEKWEEVFPALDRAIKSEEELIEARKRGQSWSESVWSNSCSTLVHIAREALNELADNKGLPRLGENFRLECGSAGMGDSSYFAEDRDTKILAHGRGRDSLKACQHAMWMLRMALADPENKERTHCAICSCPSCKGGGLSPEEPAEDLDI